MKRALLLLLFLAAAPLGALTIDEILSAPFCYELTAAKGWQLNVHAIGDAGNRTVLDVLEKSLTANR